MDISKLPSSGTSVRMTLLLLFLLQGSVTHVAAHILLAVTTIVPVPPSTNVSDNSTASEEVVDDVTSSMQFDTTTLETEDPPEMTIIGTETISLGTNMSLENSSLLETTAPQNISTVEDAITPTMTELPLETTPFPAVSMSTVTRGSTDIPKLPSNLQSLSLVFFNASSSHIHAQPSLFYNRHSSSSKLPSRESNNILSNIPRLNPDFSSPVTQQPSSSSFLHEDSDGDALSSSSSSSSPSYSSSSSFSSSSEPMNDIRMRVTSTPDSILNLTGELGGSVFLPCTTHHSMERQVSWVRRRDWHILTSGTLAYTKEERFSVHHPEGSTDWTLVIKYIESSDAGTYECQVSTGTGILSRLVELNVVEPKAVIPGNGEYHIDVGSTITLDCFIHQSLLAPQYIFWYHNSRMINYDRERGGVSVRIDTGPQVRSRLTVTRATPADSGNYTCAAANSQPAYTTVYITNGNKIAAIQPRAMAGGVRLKSCKFLFTLVFIISLLNGIC